LTSGYSGTPLAKKLGIKQGQRVVMINAPDGFEEALEELPENVRLLHHAARTAADGCEMIIAFVTTREDLALLIAELAPSLLPDGSFWVAWPKKTSGVTTDMTEDRVRDVGLPTGMVDNKVCAIDETWSGLRLVVRKENRAGWPGAFRRPV
jgi:hypothetical protein